MYVCGRVPAANAPGWTATYCVNPGLSSFLLAPPGVSTRDPSGERRNYLGEKKWTVISTESCDFHAYTFGLFSMPQICDIRQMVLLPFRRKACWGFFRPEKSDGFGRVWTPDLGYQRYRSRYRLWENVVKIWSSQTGHRWQCNIAHAHCMSGN